MTEHKHTRNETLRTIVVTQGLFGWFLLNLGIVVYMEIPWWSRIVLLGIINAITSIILGLLFVMDWDS